MSESEIAAWSSFAVAILTAAGGWLLSSRSQSDKRGDEAMRGQVKILAEELQGVKNEKGECHEKLIVVNSRLSGLEVEARLCKEDREDLRAQVMRLKESFGA